MGEDSAELLTDDERADLDAVVVGLPVAARASVEHAYIEGRVAGLCREGALELAADAARGLRDEAASAAR
jgi:hypothetical protein